MKHLILIFMLLLVVGCAKTVNGWEVNQATGKCKNFGGVDYISYYIGTDGITCNDGTVFSLTRKITS